MIQSKSFINVITYHIICMTIASIYPINILFLCLIHCSIKHADKIISFFVFKPSSIFLTIYLQRPSRNQSTFHIHTIIVWGITLFFHKVKRMCIIYSTLRLILVAGSVYKCKTITNWY